MTNQQGLAQGVAQSPAPSVSAGSTPEDAAVKEFLRRGDFTMAELMDQTLPPVPELLPGVIPTGLILLVAASKVGKSWFSLALAYAAARGKTFMRSKIDPARPVLYMALEDGPRRLQSRLKRMRATDPTPGLVFRVRIEPGEDVLAIIRGFFNAHERERPVAIIDTLGKVMGFFPVKGREGAYEHDYKMMSLLKNLTDECDGSTLMVVHHTNKAIAGDFVESVSGTNAIAGACDTILRLGRQRGETDGILEVTSRDTREGTYAVRFDESNGVWFLRGQSLKESAQIAQEQQSTGNCGDLMARIVGFVTSKDDPVDAKTVADSLGETDVKKVGNYLKRASDKGRIKRNGRGSYASLGYAGDESAGSVESKDQSTFLWPDSTLSTDSTLPVNPSTETL